MTNFFKENLSFNQTVVVLTVFFCLFFFAGRATAAPKFITTGTDVAKVIPGVQVVKTLGDVTILKYSETKANEMHVAAHQFNRCGGYMEHDSIEDALNTVKNMKTVTKSNYGYKVTNDVRIPGLISKVKEENIRATIKKLSSFKNRYYKSESGALAVKYLKELWEKNAAGRSDITVEYFQHKAWRQPSLIGTIKGKSNETIVIGGHLDSISGWFGGDNRAPGADDNASGTATVTEIFRVLSESGYVPNRTIKFMGYAAEEVGLKGSSEIAKSYREAGVPVIGALQLDMTNFKGSDKDIFLVNDYTNKELTSYLGKLIDTYVKVPYALSKCGYACSDHASWHKNGFPAAFPFEAAKGDMNGKIHTPNDTIEQSGGTAEHAVHFAQLGVAFAVELSK